jgi:peptide deformylase
MTVLPITQIGDPVLRSPAREVTLDELRSESVQRLIDDMIDTMHEYHGVGLAAPQVHEGMRFFVALLEEDPDSKTDATVVINPEIVPQGEAREDGWEGCLSIPDIRGRVPRAREIKVRGFDRTGARLELNAHDFPARVIQHETDHLDGVLFFDRMTSLASMTFLDEYARYWRKTED